MRGRRICRIDRPQRGRLCARVRGFCGGRFRIRRRIAARRGGRFATMERLWRGVGGRWMACVFIKTIMRAKAKRLFHLNSSGFDCPLHLRPSRPRERLPSGGFRLEFPGVSHPARAHGCGGWMIRWFVTTGSRLWVPLGRWARLTHAQEGSHG